MKHTPESLAVLSDFEVNKALAELLGLNVAEEQHFNFGDRLESPVIVGKPNELDAVDYCNNPSDVMPLVFEHGISVMFCNHQDGWMGIKNNMTGVSHYAKHANPLRAAACCLILVLQEQSK